MTALTTKLKFYNLADVQAEHRTMKNQSYTRPVDTVTLSTYTIGRRKKSQWKEYGYPVPGGMYRFTLPRAISLGLVG